MLLGVSKGLQGIWAVGAACLNYFDYHILVYLNHLINQSALLTRLVVAVFDDTLKLGFFVALLWWAWFDVSRPERLLETRERLVSSFIGGLVCLAIVRLMLAELPFRPRPLSNPDLRLNFPIATESWGNWSSFPSDHAALFTLLTFCLFTISFRLGLLALLDTVFLICLPRVMVGVHYPTDILGGALLGLIAGYFFTRRKVRTYLSRFPFHWISVHPASFYAAAFLFSFLMAHSFFPLINILLRMGHLGHFLTQ